MIDCCNHTKKHKRCRRKQDGKLFLLPRRFNKSQCKKDNVKGFTMKASCAPYQYCKTMKGGSHGKTKIGIAVLSPNPDSITGVVTFKPHRDGLRIHYDIQNLTDGYHGFHIHEYGDLTDHCTSACAHFNPDNTSHGGLHSTIRHAGDLGNVRSTNKQSKGSFYAPKLSIEPGKYCILGRMIIVHKERDDLGKGNNEESLKTGNAGKRLTCGVIGLSYK